MEGGHEMGIQTDVNSDSARSGRNLGSRFQFGLRTLLIVVILLTIPIIWFGWQIKIVWQRKEFLSHSAVISLVQPKIAVNRPTPSIPWFRQVAGDESRSEIIILSNDDHERAAALFPEATILQWGDKRAASH